MAITVASDMVTPQILIDAIRGRFKMRTAFMGSILVSSGACIVNGSMPKGGPSAIGKTIDIPYFGTIGDFANNADGSAVTPSKLGQMSEQATVARSSLAVETSIWAQGVGAVDPALGDPHQEGANQAMAAAEREIDLRIVNAFKATPLVSDIYSTTTPKFLDWDSVVDGTTKFADEQDNIVAMVTHSQALSDLAKLRDDGGRPLLISSMVEGQGAIRRFNGIPLLISDRVPLDGSTMTSVTSTGTSPPVLTITGTPTGAWNLQIDCVVGGAHTTATYRFSTDGGNTWSATLTTAGVGVAVALTDTAVDSLVGNNGATGLTIAFAAGTFNADNLYVATARLKVTTMICQQGAGAFWYNANALGAKSDVDILADADILAMHLYYAAHLYRRRRMGTRPGVVAIKHNVRNYQ